MRILLFVIHKKKVQQFLVECQVSVCFCMCQAENTVHSCTHFKASCHSIDLSTETRAKSLRE